MKTTFALLAVGLVTAAPVWAEDAVPSEPAPSEAPPPPSMRLPPPPSDPDAEVTRERAPPPENNGVSPAGQWTYTQQYGWVYTPYAQSYTYVGDNGETAFTYAYYPTYGWRWLPSPWVLGWGPRPYWGRYGYNRFAWHVHPWFHAGIYRPDVWTHWGHGWGHGYVYGRRYESHTVRPHYGERGGERGEMRHGGGWHRR